MTSTDTIFALSSGQLPAGIAVVRISGPRAGQALQHLAGRIPAPRRAVLMEFRDGAELLDRGLALFFPGPLSATGEDVAELHLHGGRAVVDAMLAALGRAPGLRAAEAGEFTRRALENGRLDLAEAEGLADLLEAETESQRRAALLLAGGRLGAATAAWSARIITLSAEVEALLDFADEDDVGATLPPAWEQERAALADELGAWLARPGAERLKEGVRVVIAGPPNAGKSTLLNALAGRAAAITSPVPGTTRDVIEVPMAIGGVPFLLIDSAGLRDTADPVEAVGVARAEAVTRAADLVLWLGDAGAAPANQQIVHVRAKADTRTDDDDIVGVSVSALTGQGMVRLTDLLLEHARTMLPREGDVALHRRHRSALVQALAELQESARHDDLLLVAEALRQARRALDELTGTGDVQNMLDALFARFCIGK